MNRSVLKQIILGEKLMEPERFMELDSLSHGAETSLYQTLISGGYVKEDTLLPLVAKFFRIDWVQLTNPDPEAVKLYRNFPEHLRAHENLAPLGREDESVVVACADPLDIEPLDQLRQMTGLPVTLRLAAPEALAKFRMLLGRQGSDELERAVAGGMETDEKRLADLANEAPVIKLVNLIMMQAISEGASDIHVEPFEAKTLVRNRVDGVLRETSKYPQSRAPAIISRIKIMADLNIAEHRIPQDGRISIKLMDRAYDLRVATIPTLHGEGAVIRILDKEGIMLSLPDLGFQPDTLSKFNAEIRKPNGIVLVTGPTGSGKTTTLYASLATILSPEKKIITVEDPVEYQLEGINQIHVNNQVGLTFSSGLRSILRLDPDIVMVGEIRDTETAEIAIRAALTGHLVFSTLHTNDAPSSVTRLVDMGIAPYLLSSSLNAILAQRLVRRVCEYCKTDLRMSENGRALLEESGVEVPETMVAGEGCDECNNSGYRGRVSLYELFTVTDALRELINDKAPASAIANLAREEGMKTLRDDGISKFLAGITTAEEVHRITNSN